MQAHYTKIEQSSSSLEMGILILGFLELLYFAPYLHEATDQKQDVPEMYAPGEDVSRVQMLKTSYGGSAIV